MYNDHKPITKAIFISTDKHSAREARHLSYISQFTTDIQHISGNRNTVADCLSRPTSIHNISPAINSLAPDVFEKEQQSDSNLQSELNNKDSAFDLKCIKGIYCDMKHNKIRPFVPETLRTAVMLKFHNLAHPGVDRTRRLISDRYIWPNLRHDVQKFVNACHSCQQTKIYRHNKASIQPIPFEGGKFDAVHIDIIGPMVESENCRYALTMIDRYTRLMEVIPISNITAETVAKTFVSQWVSRYGTPTTISHDRGSQFTSELFATLLNLLGTSRIKTCAYHPQSNGLIERLNKDVKIVLKTQIHPSRWVENLPLVLLALKSQYKQDLKCSSAELTFGTTLRLPGELIDPPPVSNVPEPLDYVKSLQNYMRTHTYKPPRIPNHNEDRLDNRLNSCTHVYVRIDAVRTPLTRPYKGPFKVLKRSPKYFTLEIKGKPDKVSIDRLKPAVIPSTAYINGNVRTFYPSIDIARIQKQLVRFRESNFEAMDFTNQISNGLDGSRHVVYALQFLSHFIRLLQSRLERNKPFAT